MHQKQLHLCPAVSLGMMGNGSEGSYMTCRSE